MSKEQPFLPLFFGDFLAATAEWDGEERALYLLCLGHQWELGSLPADPRKLRKLVDYQLESFDRWWPTVSGKFIELDGGDRLVNPRLEQHRAKSIQISETKASAGKAGAAARWRKDGSGNGRAMAQPMRLPSKSHGRGNASAIKSDGTANASAIRKASSSDASAIPKASGCHDSANGSIPSHPIPSESDPDPESVTGISPQPDTSAASRSARATRLPGEWTLTEARRAIAVTHGVDPERTHARFTDYWRAAAGPRSRKVDWEAAWRFWCSNEADRGGNGQRGGAGTGKPWKAPKSAEEIDTETVRKCMAEGKTDREIWDALDQMRHPDWISEKRRELEQVNHAEH